jgi:hypothetical protein
MEVYRLYSAVLHRIGTRCQDELKSNSQSLIAYLSFSDSIKFNLHAKKFSGKRFNDPVVYEKCGEKKE